ncbi:PREDICTED: ejaculatory bulb-specific protein 3-like [Trachymyrmex septentrionalis]|uniref:ejaculatory bulb-specific protein 3-like n=1 Tax=Trachymyrmex septentrionalis TaxID=34720 RepID=UPI00084F810F|nr:PREDICTED: ejaculatory bulb-specific protein 3-like [Trachymyrmex septentrionalis]
MIRLSYIVLIGIALVCVLAEEFYSDQYDNVDISRILQNDKLREEYYNCYMETGPCPTEDAKYFQEVQSEVMQTNCKKCNERQKEMYAETTKWYTQNQPEKWEALMAKSVEDMKKKNAALKLLK